jgi:hypothetical protein
MTWPLPPSHHRLTTCGHRKSPVPQITGGPRVARRHATHCFPPPLHLSQAYISPSRPPCRISHVAFPAFSGMLGSRATIASGTNAPHRCNRSPQAVWPGTVAFISPPGDIPEPPQCGGLIPRGGSLQRRVPNRAKLCVDRFCTFWYPSLEGSPLRGQISAKTGVFRPRNDIHAL